MSEVNPPPTLDDAFDHDETTEVSRDKEPESLQRELDRVAIVDITKRVTSLEELVRQLGELVRQVVADHHATDDKSP